MNQFEDDIEREFLRERAYIDIEHPLSIEEQFWEWEERQQRKPAKLFIRKMKSHEDKTHTFPF